VFVYFYFNPAFGLQLSLIKLSTAKFTDVIVARIRKCSDLIREGKVFVENKTKVASGVSCSERVVLYFRELSFKSNKKKFSFRRVESEKIGIGYGTRCNISL